MKTNEFDHLMALYRIKDKENLPEVSTSLITRAVLESRRPVNIFSRMISWRPFQWVSAFGFLLMFIAGVALFVNSSLKEEQISINITGEENILLAKESKNDNDNLKVINRFSFTSQNGRNVTIKL